MDFFIPQDPFLEFLSNSEISDRFPQNGGNRYGSAPGLLEYCMKSFRGEVLLKTAKHIEES